MRQRLLVTALAMMFFSLQSYAAIGKKDSVLIFRPGPGLNDSSDQGGISGGMDTWAYQGNPGTNYATDPYLIAAPISNCNSTHSMDYIRFDVSNLPDTVDSVFIGFTHFDHTSYCLSNCYADFYFHRVTQPWYESTINYGNQPSMDTAFYGPVNVTFPNSFGTREYNITSTYRLWRDSIVANYGMVIESPSVGCNNAAVMFYVHSSDDTDSITRPYLKIYYKADTGKIDTPVSVIPMGAGKPSLVLYPNPAHNETIMKLTADNGGNGWYIITDITGRVMQRKEVSWSAGQTQITLPLADLEPGMYYYMLYTPEGKLTEKILRE